MNLFFYKVSSFLIKIEAECSVHIHIYIISLHFFFNLFYRRVFSSTLFSWSFLPMPFFHFFLVFSLVQFVFFKFIYIHQHSLKYKIRCLIYLYFCLFSAPFFLFGFRAIQIKSCIVIIIVTVLSCIIRCLPIPFFFSLCELLKS